MKQSTAFAAKGKAYWRSLEQLARTTKFNEYLHREFPEGASENDHNNWSRRSFLTLMGASLALAGLSGCRRPVEKIVPYVKRPEEVVPGNPMTYATNMPFGTHSFGVLAQSHEGRPTKLDGNPEHPSTRGASNLFIQAAMLMLYDPDRSQAPLNQGAEREWDDFVTFWRELRLKYVENGGDGLAVLAESFASPTLASLKEEFRKTYPRATWATFEPLSDENIFTGLEIATGRRLQPVYSFDTADVVLSLDSDFLGHDGNTVRNSLDFAKRRQVLSQKDTMNRLYVVENTMTTTGAMADHRLRAAKRRVGQVALALAGELRAQGLAVGSIDGGRAGDAIDKKWLAVAAKDLAAAKGRALVVAGPGQPAWVHALVYAINDALQANGATVRYREPEFVSIPSRDELKTLTGSMSNGEVETLLVFGGNPVYNAPADLAFEGALRKVKNKISFSYYNDQTAQRCDWHLPRAHFLESWGDTISDDGTVGVIQPLIEPLFKSHSDVEFLGLVNRGSLDRGYDRVRETWRPLLGGDFEKRWRVVLHDGLLKGRDGRFVSQRPRTNPIGQAVSAASTPQPVAEGAFELDFRASQIHDGRYVNNGWLQELPHTITKITWDNAAMIAPSTAKRLNIKNEEVIRIDYAGRSLDIVAWITPGQAEDSITLLHGYGQDWGRVAEGAGFNTFALQISGEPTIGYGATVSKTNRTYELATTQDHGSMEGRPIIREATLAAYKKADVTDKEVMQYKVLKPTKPHHPPLLPMWDEHTYETGYQWGMTIDLNACTGCNVCTIACQSENNIVIVGKEQTRNGREMHWIRIDRYFAGEDLDTPEVSVQPVACQHCEFAPCESVCPVNATVHTGDGLNMMVYNRCIGTRYCSNNCPYKVRRFNFFNYTKDFPEIHKMSQNPSVTVRSRGVMEKCTYCVQRIETAKIVTKREGRKITDSDVKTACQVACPTNAIVFGDINNADAQVSKMKKLDRQYKLLEEYMTKPRTSFLAKLRNPHPELAKAEPVEDGHH